MIPNPALWQPRARPRPRSAICGFWRADDGVTLSGSTVTLLKDLSGHRNHLTGGNTPTYVANSFNGRAGITFNSTDTLGRLTYTQGAMSQPGSIYVVGKGNSTVNAGTMFAGSNVNNWAVFNSSGEIALFANNTARSGISTVVSGTPFILRAKVDNASSEFKLVRHGVATVTSSTWSTNPGAAAMNGFFLGNGQGTFNPWNGDMCSGLAMCRVATSTEDDAVFASLQKYYGITPL